MFASLDKKLRIGISVLICTTPVWAAPPQALLGKQLPLGLSFGALTVVLVVLGYLEFKAAGARGNDMAIDRLAAAAAQRKARVNTDSIALLAEDMPPETPPPSPAMPPPPPPPARSAAPPPPPPPPPPPTRAVPTFPPIPESPAPTRVVPTFPSSPPDSAADVGNTSGGWAEMLQKVRSTDSDVRRTSSAEEVKPGSGSGAWEALLKKTSGAASGESPSPFAKPGVEMPGGSPFTPKSDDDDKIDPNAAKGSKRSISLDFGGGSNPFQKPD